MLKVSAFAVSDTNLFAGTWGDGVFLSVNNGTSWTEVNSGLTNSYVEAIAVSSMNLFAGTYGGGVFLSANNGTSWTQTSLESVYVSAFAVSDTNLFAGTVLGGGVFLSTNNGTSWTSVSSGLTSLVFSLAVSGGYLFAGTWGSGVWRRPLSEMITSVEQIADQLPVRYALLQNYPNPFNPSTNISFQIAEVSRVTLKVYNLLGQEIATLVNEELKLGSYEVMWDASGMASGVYFYRIEAGQFNDTKKLILLR